MEALACRPRLVPGVDVVPLADGGLMLRSFTATIVLSGEFVTRRLAQLLPRLDGHHDVASLIAIAGADFQPELEALLRHLQDKGFLATEPDESRSTALAALNLREQAYWTLHGPAAADAAERLAQTSVVVAGLGGVGATVASALAAAGVGRLTLIDPLPVGESDIGFGFDTQDVGQPRALAHAARLDSATSRASGLEAAIDALTDWDAIAAAAGHVVLCSDTMALAGHERTNVACVAARTPWLSVRVDRTRAIIGPYVIPGQTACFTCFELRSQLNADHPSDHEAMTTHWKSAAVSEEAWPALAAFTATVGHSVALDLIQVIGSGRPSAALGRVIHFNPAGFDTRHHEVLKLPRCPACSRLRERPIPRIWDIAPAVHAEARPVAAVG